MKKAILICTLLLTVLIGVSCAEHTESIDQSESEEMTETEMTEMTEMTETEMTEITEKTWVSEFTEHDPAFWRKSSGYSNGAPFDCKWSAANIAFEDGKMELKLTNDAAGNKLCAEYQTITTYHYGKYEVRMKAAKNIGIVSSFFVYTGPAFGTPWDEVDIEFLGKDTTKVQLNYFTNGVGGHEKIIELGFDASEQFHDYAFEWNEDSINWYVDGQLVHTATENLPVTPAKIMMNLWNGIGVDGWLGTYDGASPITAQYEWMKFTPSE